MHEIIAAPNATPWKEEEEFFEKPDVAPIVCAARKAGLSVAAIPDWNYQHSKGPVQTKTLYIQGKKCSLYFSRKAWRTQDSLREYALIHISTSRLQRISFLLIAILIPSHAERVFVIPASILRDVIDMRRRTAMLYIPLRKFPATRGSKAAVDYWQFENAWHLVSDVPTPPIST